jgi:hypothetical protein
MMNDLDLAYEYKLKSMPRGIDAVIPVKFKCNTPHRVVVVDLKSNCFLCSCDGHLPIPVGQVQDFDTLEAVWNSPTAKLLQQDIDSGKFTWCAVEHCGIRHRNIIRPVYQLGINIDESCNLHCPSCRRDSIMHAGGAEFDKKTQDLSTILGWLEKFQHPIQITLSGNGDPFASQIIRPLFKNFVPRNTHKFRLMTNGLLIRKQLSSSQLLPHIEIFSISVDAGSAAVYHQVRRGGQWDVLMDNFDFLTKSKKNHLVQLNFAVQKSNYKDLYNFVELCCKYNFAGNIHQLDDWGTWNYDTVQMPDTWTIANGTYLDHNVLVPSHPEHQECLRILTDIINQKNKFITYTSIIKNLNEQK